MTERNTQDDRPTHKEIESLAFEIYEHEGRPPEHDVDDWLMAKRSLIKQRDIQAHEEHREAGRVSMYDEIQDISQSSESDALPPAGRSAN